MDIYSQRNCRMKGLILLKVSGRRLLKKQYGDHRWKVLKIYQNMHDCYLGAIEIVRLNAKYVKL